MYKKYFKRSFDIFFSTVGLIAVFPFIIALAILIFRFLGWPIIFKQKRLGYKGKIFTIYKFRTMKNFPDGKKKLISDEKRLTKLGNFLRRTGLDELPQLLNILFGSMSFVGPRALLVEYMDKYTPEQFRRHEVKPGLTCLPVIDARKNLSWEEQFDLDIKYVKNLGFCLDLKLLVLTFWAIVQGKDKKKDVWLREKFTGTKMN